MQVAYAGGDRPSRHRCCVGHVWMTRDQYDQLMVEASTRGLHPDVLIARVVDAVIDEKLFRAVLSD